MKKLFSTAMIVISMFVLIGCGTVKKGVHTEGVPDVISSISFNKDTNLTVIANRNEIEDKVEFAKLLVKMCQENSFKSIRFSTDSGYATSLNMSVYCWQDDIGEKDSVMKVEFRPAELNWDYDIVNHSEKFELYVDGTLIEE